MGAKINKIFMFQLQLIFNINVETGTKTLVSTVKTCLYIYYLSAFIVEFPGFINTPDSAVLLNSD